MNVVFKLMMWSLMLNFAAGIMTAALPFAFGEGMEVNRGGLTYNESYSRDFTDELNQSINPTDRMDDTSDLFDRLLDKLTIGIWGKFLEALNRYIYGFVQILDVTIGRFLAPGVRTFLFGASGTFNIGIMRTFITLGYILGAIYLWTGRDLRR